MMGRPKLRAGRQPEEFVERVERASQQRFADRPVYAIGDVIAPLIVPTVEESWRLDTGGRITILGDSAKPDEPILPPDYPIRDPGKAWVLVFAVSASGSMPEAARQLMGRRGIVGYWPRAIRAVQRGRGPKRHLEQRCTSLFRGYVLAHVTAGTDLKAKLEDQEARRYGVGGAVRFGQRPAWIGGAVVEEVVRREREGEFDETEIVDGAVVKKGQSWQASGSMVRIVDGPFRDFCAPIVSIDRAKSVVTLSVSIFDRASPVDMALDAVEPVEGYCDAIGLRVKPRSG